LDMRMMAGWAQRCVTVQQMPPSFKDAFSLTGGDRGEPRQKIFFNPSREGRGRKIPGTLSL
jgi:hypothetical protein